MLRGTLDDKESCAALHQYLESDPSGLLAIDRDASLGPMGFLVRPDGVLALGTELYDSIEAEGAAEGLPDQSVPMYGAGAN